MYGTPEPTRGLLNNSANCVTRGETIVIPDESEHCEGQASLLHQLQAISRLFEWRIRSRPRLTLVPFLVPSLHPGLQFLVPFSIQELRLPLLRRLPLAFQYPGDCFGTNTEFRGKNGRGELDRIVLMQYTQSLHRFSRELFGRVPTLRKAFLHGLSMFDILSRRRDFVGFFLRNMGDGCSSCGRQSRRRMGRIKTITIAPVPQLY